MTMTTQGLVAHIVVHGLVACVGVTHGLVARVGVIV